MLVARVIIDYLSIGVPRPIFIEHGSIRTPIRLASRVLVIIMVVEVKLTILLLVPWV